MDYFTDTVLSIKTALFGTPKISPDSRYLSTIDHKPYGVVIGIQKITINGLFFEFDVQTSLNISDVTFYQSQTMPGYDYLYASASDKEDILFLNLYTGELLVLVTFIKFYRCLYNLVISIIEFLTELAYWTMDIGD